MRLPALLKSWWISYPFFGIVYILSSGLSRQLVFSEGAVASVWLSFGVAIAILMRFGVRYWISMAVAEIASGYLFYGLAPVMSELIALGNVVTVLVGFWFLRRIGKVQRAFRRQNQVFVLVLLTALLSPIFSAATGAGSLLIWGYVPKEAFVTTFMVWWQADVIGILVVTPFLITIMGHTRRSLAMRSRREALALVATVLLTLLVVFSVPSLHPERSLAVAYLLFPLIIWAAARFEVLGSTLTTLVVSAVLIVATIHGIGPFYRPEVRESLIFMQAFIGAFAATGLFVAVNTLERRLAADALRHSNARLEARVARRTRELNRAKNAAEDANRTKSLFLATMSHEIRTPMNGVLGFTEILRDSPLNSTQREQLDIVHRSGTSLLELINDILDFSKIESGRLKLDPHAFSIRQLVEDTFDLLAPKIRTKDLDLVCSVHPDLPPRIVADSTRLRQVLVNLVGNSIKFTESGTIEVQVTGMPRPVQEQASDSAMADWPLKIEVRDTGIGMSDAQMAILFEPFVQADSSTTRKYGGSGLGLAICRRICETMGGGIRVASQPGAGSVFTAEILARHSPQPTEESADASSLRAFPATPPHHFLIVDDNQANRTSLAALLAQWGINSTLAADAEAALKVLGTSIGISGMITDYTMPGMNGTDLVQRVRALERYRTLPIILQTSVRKPESHRDFQPDLFALVLQKPTRAAHIHAALATVMEGNAGKSVPGPRSQLEAAPPQPKVFSPLQVLIAEDNAVNQRVCAHFLRKLGFHASFAANGKEAVRHWEEHACDVILMDVQMPEMDGLTASRLIREKEAIAPAQPSGNPRCYIVAVTAGAQPEDRQNTVDAGMDDYLIKPLQVELLAAAMKRAEQAQLAAKAAAWKN